MRAGPAAQRHHRIARRYPPPPPPGLASARPCCAGFGSLWCRLAGPTHHCSTAPISQRCRGEAGPESDALATCPPLLGPWPALTSVCPSVDGNRSWQQRSGTAADGTSRRRRLSPAAPPSRSPTVPGDDVVPAGWSSSLADVWLGCATPLLPGACNLSCAAGLTCSVLVPLACCCAWNWIESVVIEHLVHDAVYLPPFLATGASLPCRCLFPACCLAHTPAGHLRTCFDGGLGVHLEVHYVRLLQVRLAGQGWLYRVAAAAVYSI